MCLLFTRCWLALQVLGNGAESGVRTGRLQRTVRNRRIFRASTLYAQHTKRHAQRKCREKGKQRRPSVEVPTLTFLLLLLEDAKLPKLLVILLFALNLTLKLGDKQNKNSGSIYKKSAGSRIVRLERVGGGSVAARSSSLESPSHTRETHG